jgi:histidinol-phosphate phosphatase family protein
MKSAFVIFDRDGTLVEHVHYLTDPNLVKFKQDLIPALSDLQTSGFRFGIITNQSVIGRKMADLKTVNKINHKIIDFLRENGITIVFTLICPHIPEDNCECRKPRIMLGTRAEIEFGVDLRKSFVIGDQESDMQFGKNLGCKVVQVRGNAGFSPLADKHSDTLHDAARWIIRESSKEFKDVNSKK